MWSIIQRYRICSPKLNRFRNIWFERFVVTKTASSEEGATTYEDTEITAAIHTYDSLRRIVI